MFFRIIMIIIGIYVLSELGIILAKKIATKYRLYDYPNHRKLHEKPVLLLGGLPLLIAALISLFFFSNALILLVLSGAFIIFILGLIDDKYNLSPKIKFWLPFLACLTIVQSGLYFKFHFPYWVNLIITLAFFVLVVNTFNFIDGIDGLNSSVSILVYLTLIIFIYPSPLFYLPLLMIVANAVFLRHNLSHKKIFLGDAGSMLSGFVIAALVVLSVNAAYIKSYTSLIFLSYPLFDGMFVGIIRTLHLKPFWIGDRNHIHYRLMELGLNKTKVLILIVFVVLITTITSILFELTRSYLIFFILILFYLAFCILIFLKNHNLMKIK